MSSVGLLAVIGGFSIWHWLIVLALVLVLFGGKGKISSMMGDLAKGIQSFRKGLKEGEEETRGGAAAIADAHNTVDVAPESNADKPRTDA